MVYASTAPKFNRFDGEEKGGPPVPYLNRRANHVISSRRMFAIYRTLFKTALAGHLQYRAALLIWLMGFVLEPVVYMVVWTTIATSRGGTIGTFSQSDLTVYYLASMLLNHL